jgi:hypothetical protein
MDSPPKTGRNDPCPCGSGLKYKKCCASKDEAALAARLRDEAADATPPADAAGTEPGGEAKHAEPRAGKPDAAPSRAPPKTPITAQRMPVRRKPV